MGDLDSQPEYAIENFERLQARKLWLNPVLDSSGTAPIVTLNRRFVDASSGHIYTHLTYHSCSWRSSMAEQRFCKPAGASEPLGIPMSYKGGDIVSWDAV